MQIYLAYSLDTEMLKGTIAALERALLVASLQTMLQGLGIQGRVADFATRQEMGRQRRSLAHFIITVLR